MYTWDEQQQQLQQPMISDTDRAPSSTDLNNLNAIVPTSYDNNINHLNSLYHKGNLNNGRESKPRRSLNAPARGSRPQTSRSRSPTVRSYTTNDSMFTDSDYEAHLLDFLLLGDDFLLFMARMELRCKFKKSKFGDQNVILLFSTIILLNIIQDLFNNIIFYIRFLSL